MHGINNFWMRCLILVALSVIVCSVVKAQVEYPVGTVIEVTDQGVVVTAPEEEVASAGDTTTTTTTTTSYTPDPSDYCYGVDYSLADCDQSRNFDPWIASTGEKPYWIRNRLTLVIPFTLPPRTHEHASKVKYGYFQMTTSERKRDPAKEGVFHVWFSEEPNGVPIGGKGSKCEKWLVQARKNFYWTQDEALAGQVCFLGHSEKVLYANFETACYATTYNGECSDNNKQKSHKSYQFDVARQTRGY